MNKDTNKNGLVFSEESKQPKSSPDASGGAAPPGVILPAPQQLPSFDPASFNIDAFRLDQSLVEHAGGKKLITTIPVRKPSKECWFRTHPDEEYRLPCPVIELKEKSETYLVGRPLWAELTGESTFVAKLLVPTLTRQGDLLLWPIRLPGEDGNLDDWNASAMEAATIAQTKWVRMSAKRSLGAYEIIVGPDPQPEANWPELSFAEIVRIAFKGRVIETLDHPVIRQLRGLS
ncbi:MAG: hypothetical protein KA236_15660 [Verrucomicrobia bacterium]|jgi:hypothetical protein|nr:hypothetical protein [Verrucomicrobiota bacterium]